MSSLAIYGPHSSSTMRVSQYRTNSETCSASGERSTRAVFGMLTAALAAAAPYVASVGHHTASSSVSERISVASNVEFAVSRKSARKLYSRNLTQDEHRVFQEAILDNAEIVHRGRYVEL